MKITLNEIKAMVRECVKRLLNEEIPDNPIPHMERCSTECNIMLGRFQPFTLGHLKCLKEIKNQTGRPTMLFVSPGKGDEKKPFKGELQDEMLKILRDAYPSLILDCIYLNGANIFEITDKCRERGYEPVSWTCGTDRSEAYKTMFSKYSDRYEYDKKLNLSPNFEVVTLNRDDDNISATRVREALKSGNKTEFEAMMPKALYCLFNDMRNVLTPEVLNETRGVMSSEIEPIADYIVQKINSADYKNFVVPDKICKFLRKYLHNYKPINVVYVDDINETAAFIKGTFIIEINPTSKGITDDTRTKSSIMHELTHLINYWASTNPMISGHLNIDNDSTIFDRIADSIIYLFNGTEINARKSEFAYYLLKHPDIKTLSDPKAEKIIRLAEMEDCLHVLRESEFDNNGSDLVQILAVNKGIVKQAKKRSITYNDAVDYAPFLDGMSKADFYKCKTALVKELTRRFKRFENSLLKILYDYNLSGSNGLS